MPQTSTPPQSAKMMIRLKTAVRDEDSAAALMKSLANLPGTHLVYRDGDTIVSLHADSSPASRTVNRTARVPVLFAST